MGGNFGMCIPTKEIKVIACLSRVIGLKHFTAQVRAKSDRFGENLYLLSSCGYERKLTLGPKSRHHEDSKNEKIQELSHHIAQVMKGTKPCIFWSCWAVWTPWVYFLIWMGK